MLSSRDDAKRVLAYESTINLLRKVEHCLYDYITETELDLLHTAVYELDLFQEERIKTLKELLPMGDFLTAESLIRKEMRLRDRLANLIGSGQYQKALLHPYFFDFKTKVRVHVGTSSRKSVENVAAHLCSCFER